MKFLNMIGACVILMTGTMCSRDMPTAVQSVRIELKLCGPIFQGVGAATPTDYAVWIETADGRYVKTLKITLNSVSVGEFNTNSSGHLRAWAEKAGVTFENLKQELLPETGGVPTRFDAITQASPYFTSETATEIYAMDWDLRDEAGASVITGQYHFCAEAANIFRGADSTDSMTIINAENTVGVVDLERSIVTPATPTAHIKSLTAQLFDMRE